MKGHVSTSSVEKIELDVVLTSKICLNHSQYVIMPVGAADGLLRHLEGAYEVGADLRKVVIFDHNPEVIRLLKAEYAANLTHYPEPEWIVSDLNKLLGGWPPDKPIGWLDFDGTSGVGEYHMITMRHAERLGAQYVTLVGCSRVQSRAMTALAAEFPLVWRRRFVPKAEQRRTRGFATDSYAAWGYWPMPASQVMDELAKRWGWTVLHSCTYQGVSPMSCSLYTRH